MRKPSITHRHLRGAMAEMLEKMENTPEETFRRFEAELKHSCLIIAGDVANGEISIPTVSFGGERFGLLFTDMDEFRKAFPGYEVESRENLFAVYYEMLMNSALAGFIVNIESERFFLPKEGFEKNEELPIFEYPTDDAYTSEELKRLKDEISNGPLEEFIQNPRNAGRYEELFERISSSVVMTLMLSRNDLSAMERNGVISIEEQKPLGFLYTHSGEYAAVFTSEEKILNVDTHLNRYSQLVNFSCLVNFVLNDDMDGIVINPESDNIVLTREILLEFAPVLDEICNDAKLNSAMFHIFPMEA